MPGKAEFSHAIAFPSSQKTLSLLHPHPLIKAVCLWCREEYIAMGLFHVAKAVSFLNNDCNVVRGFSLPHFMSRLSNGLQGSARLRSA